MQTHIAETKAEVAWIKELFPDRRDYLDVYDHHGLCGKRAVFGHGIWLEDGELQRLHDDRRRDRPLPDLQLLPGQRRLRSRRALDPKRPVRVGLGTDIGGGTSFSILATLGEAYKASPSSTGRPCRPGTPTTSPRAVRRRAMYLDDQASAALPLGMEADLGGARHAVDAPDRLPHGLQARDFAEQLFVQMTLGDDRAVQATYVGRPPGLCAGS